MNNDKKRCPHLACLVYHSDGICACDFEPFCEECKLLAQIASRDKEVIAEERKRLGEKIVGMKQIETPMWEWDEGYNQAIDDILSLIEEEPGIRDGE